MQRPPEMKWERPECIGDRPSKRSGHTFTEVDSFAYLFGGCTAAELRGGKMIPPSPSNELYKLDLGSGGSYYWTKLKGGGKDTSSVSSRSESTDDGEAGVGAGAGADASVCYEPANSQQQQQQQQQQQPPPRWNHTANKMGDTRIVVFGGFTGSKDAPHLNDVWVLDASNDTWAAVDIDTTADIDAHTCAPSNTDDDDDDDDDDRRSPWRNGPVRKVRPQPRGSHSASVIDNALIVFGGYGGSGYTRRDFADVHALCLNTWQWYDVKTTGGRPHPRSGHQSVAIEGDLYVMGGWNASQQYDDLHILDGRNLTWSQPMTACGPDSWGPRRWNFTAVSVFAVPYRKVFVFGGNTGALDASNPLGEYQNNVQVLECVDSSTMVGVEHGGDDDTDSVHDDKEKWSKLEWTHPPITGDQPSPRASSPMFYSSAMGKLVLFGGWSNRWHDDVYTCEVADVVGPPYNIFALESSDLRVPGAPVTGGTAMVLTGKGFTMGSTSASATVRLACARGYLDVNASVVGDTEIRFDAPNYEKFGPVQAQVRLKVGPKSFTNGVVQLPYFSVTDCTKTVAFGPGLLDGTVVCVPTTFIIQAKDKDCNNRICGMDEFGVIITRVMEDGLGSDGSATPATSIPYSLSDDGDGTYTVKYTPEATGSYQINVEFAGTFGGRAGSISGSPFTCVVTQATSDDVLTEEGNERDIAPCTELAGKALQNQVASFIKTLRSFTLASAKGLGKSINQNDLKALLSVKEHLRKVSDRSEEFEIGIASNKAALGYLRKRSIKFPALDKTIKSLDAASDSWNSVKASAPVTEGRIASANAEWTDKIRFKIEACEKDLEGKLRDFRQLEFWNYAPSSGDSDDISSGSASSTSPVSSTAAMGHLKSAEEALKSETRALDENQHLCDMFELGDMVNTSRSIVEEMKTDLVEMAKLWNVSDTLNAFIRSSEQHQWTEINAEELEDGGKAQLKACKGLHKCTRWSDAFKSVDRKCKDFLSTIPLVTMLGAKAMRPRHWELLKKATSAPSDFVPPCEDEHMLLGSLLSLDLVRYGNDVEEIYDQASKEEKMEITLGQIDSRWSAVVFTMTAYKNQGSEEEIPLLGIGEEDYEALENDQLAVQGMLASRFVAQFQQDVNSWQRALFNVNEVFLLLSSIQRTWSYLEPLFIHSDEVKRELPEDATRFATIDVDVRETLTRAWDINNVKDAFNEEGLYQKLEGIQEQLDICKKSLADFLDGRRRQFPRYYFVSEADLLDILSNGSNPDKILHHVPKVYLSTKTFTLDPEQTSETGRPIATDFVAGVGSEVVRFEPPVALEGKVEQYMQTVLDAQKVSIFETVKRSLLRYKEHSRPDWVLSKEAESGRPRDPAQTTLLVLAINYVAEVEAAFRDLEELGKADALQQYSKKQVEQLSDLIKLTQSNLSKGDRTRVMVCITMDAHARDVVDNMVREKIDRIDSFMWQSQLKHKFRVPPAHANYQGRDPHLRGSSGERAEIAICDAVLPYDYEYLGNGPRLVITPLTDRIYVTATQALNLKMGCAPAGPAGTGKTETTKDLANALAKLIYVINCSPEMDYKGLGNIFKGVASSGAWVCFDEFNRLIPEVLSVCTVQFKAVCDGIAADASRIRVEGDEILLDPTCGAFITMNPGYLGRSELPEGLKALFRPMTVMVPDLVLICENMLMAEGFVTAKILASKFFCLYSLLKALLSAQLHYDWGLRAIKSVLVVAGSFKRAEPNLSEDALLMRALRDFNIPKIVREDEVVFFGLLGDLFPGIDPPRKRDEAFESYVTKACERLGNHPDETFCLKVVQLEELLAIRHCVFVMGPAGSGKSQCWRTLQEARNLRDPDMPTKVVDLNPKAVKTEELYGYISMATREWRDGLLSSIMRDLSSIPDEKPKWILLDGDLDANWIESMNSVMDDNRMLTLASNERIPLLPHMRMIFEIRDLKHATPATVSRAGILFISTDDGTQWRSLIHSWIEKKRHPKDGISTASGTAGTLNLSGPVVDALEKLFPKYIDDALMWLLLKCKSVVPIEDMNRVQVLLNMLDGCLNRVNTVSAEAVEVVFVYCAVWALGSSLGVSDDGTDYRKLFSDWWRGHSFGAGANTSASSSTVKFPSRDTIFDYWLDPETNAFDSWRKCPFFYSVDYDSRATPMTQVTVPTPESCSVSYWMDLLAVQLRKPMMLAGPAGTGKTQLVQGMLNSLDRAVHTSTTINFNYYTTSSVLATTMALPLEKKTGSNYGPPGTTKMVYFVDDLNLPEVDTYNTQSAIAHLRQHMEYEHCYELDKMSLKNIMNTQVVTCMNPTAGSFVVNPRLQRWFATFAVALPGSTSLLTIYQSFLDGHLACLPFADDVREQSTNVIKAAMGLHSLVSGAFKKTAVNFHYEFNIRHISNVFQGLLVSSPETVTTPDKLVLLWLHESERVYGDRLVNAEDLARYNSIVQTQCKKIFPSFPIAKYYSKENAEPLLFSHFAESIERPIYNQITSLVDMNQILDGALREYNETNATMDLVLFEDAMNHVARIVRIIRNEGGHALLVGVGGSGKQSLARLAAYICGFSVTQIVISSSYSITDFKDDLKLMYRKAGLKEEGLMFLLTDSQITNERFLVYLNDLLASGNIPDLFAPDEVDEIINAVTNRVKATGVVPDRKNCWDYYMRQIRKNLHVCLCFSPVGNDFRTRALRFPALVNCTVIDMFQPWPQDALYSVGKKFLSNVDLGTDAERDVIERFLPFSFDAVNKATVDFRLEDRRHVYTTPKSYLELIKLYSSLLEEKRSDATAAIDRLDSGLTKLRQTSESVAKLEEDLRVMLEDAAIKKEKAEGIAEVVAKEKASVEVENANAQLESEQVAKIQQEVSQKQRDTEADLAKAEPAVEAAMSALDTLDQKDLSSCKGMKTPPPKLDEVFVATMCLLAGIMPSVVTKKNGQVKDTSWDAAKKQLMSNIKEYMTYLKEIKTHVDDNTINHNNFKEVRQYIEKDYFNVETIKTKNQAAAGLCSFVLNIVQYYDIVVTVEPKRKALREANVQLADANSKLKAVTEHVAELKEKLSKLTHEFEEANVSKQEAMDAVEKGERKLNLAQRLTTALSSENERWGENVKALRSDAKRLTGDVLLASAFISYAGPFSKSYRVRMMENIFKPFLLEGFRKAAATVGTNSSKSGGDNKDTGGDSESTDAGVGGSSSNACIPMSEDGDPRKILTTEAEVAQWNADTLPSDIVSTENGSIVCNTSRWPLLIDPQLQGIRWLKQKESAPERNLQIVRLGQKDMIRKLESALENGHTLIIENIGETIDAVLNPVIQRATIKRGSRYFIKVGDKECDFHPDFRLYLHTKLSNPHYPPEIQAETTLINFTVTMAGLEDQLLNLVVEKERPDLAATSAELVRKLNGFTITMKELEDNILFKLAAAEGDITEDVELIEGLEETKRISNDIEQQSELARQTQTDILRTSEKYRTVANRSSLLFFLMNDLAKIHTYYIFSLEAFQQAFFRAIDLVGASTDSSNEDGDVETDAAGGDEDTQSLVSASTSGKCENVSARCECLKDSITLTLFNYIRRGLFENDKLTVATLLTFKILVNDGCLDPTEVEYLVQSKASSDPGNLGPLQEWLPETVWPKIKGLEGLACFQSLGDDMQSDSDDWSDWFDVENVECAKLPGLYEKDLTDFQKLILLRALRPDRLVCSLESFIGDTMGKPYVSQRPFNMKATFEETTSKTPVFFVLFAGVDPTPWVEALGREMGMSLENKRFVNISMGQGQEAPAEAILKRYAKEGGWVMLQNCHLMSSWVPKLERLLEIISEDAHEDFRCFLSAEPPPLASMANMPESLLQSCIKVANEAPSDIRSNLIRAWDNFDQGTIDACTKPAEMKACLFSLCWFHAVVCGRRRFGQQGWSRKYSFNTGDLIICANVLRSYLDANDEVPWDDLRYIFGEIMYGGHITDAWDRRTCNTYLREYQDPALLTEGGLELGPGFKNPSPGNMSYSDYIKYVEDHMPPESPPLFGLHSNAEIKTLTERSDNICFNMLQMGVSNGGNVDSEKAKSAGDSCSGSNIIKDTLNDMLSKLPEEFEMVALQLRAKPLLDGPSGPYVVVALQECSRMNALLAEMRRSLLALDSGLRGALNMSKEMEDLAQAIRINQWPGRDPHSKAVWEKLAWPSQKNLREQFTDLLRRVEQLQKWTNAFDTPRSLWFSGLFNPMAYLTALKQVVCRDKGLSLDEVGFEIHVVEGGDIDSFDSAVDGTFIHGLYLEGGCWCDGTLQDARPKELVSKLPPLFIKVISSKEEDKDGYEAPVYYSPMRGPTYLFSSFLPCRKVSQAVLRGTALLLSPS